MGMDNQGVLYPDVDPRTHSVCKVMHRYSGIVHEIPMYPFTLCGKEVVLDEHNTLPFGIRHRTVFGIAAGYQVPVTCKSCHNGLTLRGALR